MIMKSISHTPWKAKFGSGGWVVLSARGEVVAYVPQDFIHAELNSHLIAAAPDLLAALEMALESLDAVDVPQEWDCRSKARAAIAKAKAQIEY
jgi:hypothetical protein